MDQIRPSASTPLSSLSLDQSRQAGKKPTMDQVGKAFESLFMQSMMKSMRESVMKSDLSENAPLETYQGMFDKEVSMQLAKRNSIGLADMLVKNLEQMEAAKMSTAEILKMREEGGMPAAKPIPLNPKEIALPLNNERRPEFKLPKSGAIPLNMMPGLGKNFDRNSL